jgi:UDP-N-acetylmuramate-alanine ligase
LVFIIEADEFNHHFLFLEPDISIITSLDHDHVDIYPTREEYLSAFNQFCHNTKKVVFAPTPVALQLPDQDLKIHVPLIQQFSFDYLI